MPEKPGFFFMKGIAATNRSILDEVQDCAVCGLFRRHPDGAVEIHITAGSPRNARPIEWCVTELTTALRHAITSDEDRTAMAKSGALRSALAQLRGEYKARGVDFDAGGARRERKPRSWRC